MLKQIVAKVVTFFMLLFCAVPALGLTLKAMRPGADTPLSIELHATKRTEHALAVKMADGSIYYADMMPVANSFPGGMFARIDSQVYQVGPVPKFFVTTTPSTSGFHFSISAAGSFIVDWGDGEVQQIVRTDTSEATYMHSYRTAGAYTIGIGGAATEYSTSSTDAAISFQNNKNIASVDGSLGAIFSTIGDGITNGQQPQFYYTFSGNTSLTGIPETLFAGITGPAASSMFSNTFNKCTGLTSLPEGLFSSITGPAASYMFSGTFRGCTGLKQLPAGLFSTITGPAASSMFRYTFYGCTSLSGPSARINGQYLYEIWPSATTSQVGQCYRNDTGLDDYDSIPTAWK